MARIIEQSLGRTGNLIDVGAHAGEIIGAALRSSPDGSHIAYEPIPAYAQVLRERYPHIRVREIALSNENGVCAFQWATKLPGYSGLKERTYPGDPGIETIQVTTRRLDDDLPAGYVATVIKIDVEGAEGLVFEGALETLRRHRPVVIFEHGQGGSDLYGTRPSDVYKLLCDEVGLRLFDLDGNQLTLEGLEASYYQGFGWNYVARP